MGFVRLNFAFQKGFEKKIYIKYINVYNLFSFKLILTLTDALNNNFDV